MCVCNHYYNSLQFIFVCQTLSSSFSFFFFSSSYFISSIHLSGPSTPAWVIKSAIFFSRSSILLPISSSIIHLVVKDSKRIKSQVKKKENIKLTSFNHSFIIRNIFSIESNINHINYFCFQVNK